MVQTHIAIEHYVPAPPLVGVELNPGPLDAQILSEEQRWEVIFLAKHFKLSQRAIARKVGCSQAQVSKLLGKYKATGSIHDLPRTGRKRKATAALSREWKKQALKGQPATQIARTYRTRTKKKLHEQTVRNALHEQGLLVLNKEPVEELTAANRHSRIEYAKEMKEYNWDPVVFSDEKTFWLGSGPTKQWQEPGKRKKREVAKYPPKLNVWGAVGSYMKSKLYFFDTTMDADLYKEVITHRLTPKTLIYAPDAPKTLKKTWVYLQDNARPHKTEGNMKVLKKLTNNRLITHPPNSPDLNPMEDMWAHLVRLSQSTRVKSIDGLKRKLSDIWTNLPWDLIRKSTRSMPKRLKQCKDRGGARTDY